MVKKYYILISRKMRESIEIEKHNTIDQEAKPLDNTWRALFKGSFKRMQHCPTLLDQQCWTIVGQRVQTDATISQQRLAVQLVQNSVRK